MVAASDFSIEKLGESSGHCDCCGHTTRRIWGLIHGQPTAAAYSVTWTADHFAETGANLDLIVGQWGDGTSPSDRVAISLIHREQEEGGPALMVVDANMKATGDGALAAAALRRDEVIGTPLAPQVFAMIDAIYSQDDRLFR